MDAGGRFFAQSAKAQPLCDSYRMACFSRLDSLAEQCDSVFVHSSTASHFSVIGELLNRGVHVYVDKPLAETLEQGEQLLELAERRGKTLMVGFNRRFAPLYRQLKQQMNQPASIRMDKHRADSVGRTIYVLPCWMITCTWWTLRCGWRAEANNC